jgi:chemotaxis protein methyltransferase CheR
MTLTTQTRSGRMSDEQFNFFVQYLSNKYGLRIPQEKRVLLESRIFSRINALKLSSVDQYIQHAFKSEHAQDEYQHFVDHVTTHKTFFFRESYQFDFLLRILPTYCLTFPIPRPVNIWSAGCSTGEEVYTLGMTMQEKRAEMTTLDYRIIGTDVSIPSLKKAAKGNYSIAELENIPDHLKQRYFQQVEKRTGTSLQFTNVEITNRIKLGVLNLNNKQYNLPGEFDFIFCRNVTIYFDAKTRTEVLSRMVSKLKPGGYLFLGHSETALGTNLPLKSIQPTIYQKTGF